MRRRIWTIGTVAAALVLAVAGPASAGSFPGVPAPGGTLQPVELALADSTTGGFVVQDFGAARWTVQFTQAAVAACAGGHTVAAIGVLDRGPRGSFAVGPVLAARLYGMVSGSYTIARDLTGEQLLACLRTVQPTLPDGTEFSVTNDPLRTAFPAGVQDAAGTLDIVATSAIGYVVSRRGDLSVLQPGAPIGGAGNAPTVTRLSNGGLRTVIRADNAALYSSDVSATRRFSGWRSAGGGASDDPTAAQLADGGTGAWFVGLNGRLYQGVWTAAGAFVRYIALGTPEAGGLTGAPGVAAIGGGRFTVAVNSASGGRMWTRTYTPGAGWGAWSRVPGVLSGRPSLAAVSSRSGDFQLFWIDGALHVHTRRAVNGVWGTAFDLGGEFVRVSATARGAIIDLFLDGFQPPGGYVRRFDGAWGPLFAV